jgi:hypothetical protein
VTEFGRAVFFYVDSALQSSIHNPSKKKGHSMKNPLDSLWGTVISGLVLTVVLYYVVKQLVAVAA